MTLAVRKFLDGLVESIPLTLFLIYSHVAVIRESHDWLLPYLLASVAAMASMIYVVRREQVLNRLSLGINLYFFSGVFGLLVDWTWLNHLYGELRGLGMLYWIFAVGCITTYYSRYGFLGVEHGSRLLFARWALLLLCIPAVGMALYFSDNRFLGEWCPFIFLFFMRGFLLARSRQVEPVLAN
jgi:hypothetical protein